ncbi:MAG: hypothetical protein ABMB14_21425, partial [Myxococcota bacterium]
LVPGSPFLRELTAPIPPSVTAATFGLAGDLVVPASRATLPGVPHRTIPGPGGPWVHQWLVFSTPMAAAVVDALS